MNIIEKIMQWIKELFSTTSTWSPKEIIFQNKPDLQIISSLSRNNSEVKFVYYETPSLASANYFIDTKNLISTISDLKPYWDIRYTNPITTRAPNSGEHSGLSTIDNGVCIKTAGTDASGSGIQYKPVVANQDPISAGCTINLFD